jgi:hypothetical protein
LLAGLELRVADAVRIAGKCMAMLRLASHPQFAAAVGFAFVAVTDRLVAPTPSTKTAIAAHANDG